MGHVICINIYNTVTLPGNDNRFGIDLFQMRMKQKILQYLFGPFVLATFFYTYVQHKDKSEPLLKSVYHEVAVIK